MSAALGQPIKWPGGKNYIAREIVSLMPPHLNYCEPYFGGGAVLFARDPDDERLWLKPHKGVSEVVNDLNKELTNFWMVLQGEESFALFKRRVDAVPFSWWEWNNANRRLLLDEVDVDCAVKFFIACRQSLAGRMKSFTGITKTRTRSRMNNEVSAWLNAVEGLPAVHERLKRVLILPPQPALDVIRKFDGPDTLFYLDPPYLHETRATTTEYGPHEMSAKDHGDLLRLLGGISGKFMLSGYESPLYSSFRRSEGWTRHDFSVPNQASHKKTKERKTECLWCNF